MINPTPYDAPTATLYKPQPAGANTAAPRTPGERIIAAEIQAQERRVSRLLQDEEVNRMQAEETIARMRADLATLKARTQ